MKRPSKYIKPAGTKVGAPSIAMAGPSVFEQPRLPTIRPSKVIPSTVILVYVLRVLEDERWRAVDCQRVFSQK